MIDLGIVRKTVTASAVLAAISLIAGLLFSRTPIGIGLAAGFFLYFLVLIFLVGISKNFDVDWFLDGRRKKPATDYVIPAEVRGTGGAMGDEETE